MKLQGQKPKAKQAKCERPEGQREHTGSPGPAPKEGAGVHGHNGAGRRLQGPWTLPVFQGCWHLDRPCASPDPPLCSMLEILSLCHHDLSRQWPGPTPNHESFNPSMHQVWRGRGEGGCCSWGCRDPLCGGHCHLPPRCPFKEGLGLCCCWESGQQAALNCQPLAIASAVESSHV